MRFLLFLLVPFFLKAAEFEQQWVKPKKKVQEAPWLTGPLLTSSAYTIPKGHFNIEPYVFFTHDIGAFGANGNFHATSDFPETILSIEIIQMGLTDNIDLNLYPQFLYSYQGETSHLAMGDITIGVSYQLIRESKKYYGLTSKIGLDQVFPCARFDNLDPQEIGIQGIGGGGWNTSLYLSVHKLFHLYGTHFLAARAAIRGVFFVPFYIHGASIFGADESTRGKIARGASAIGSVAIEYTLSKNWAFSLDIENTYTTGSTFTGTTDVPVGEPKAAYLLSFAPALEYNFSKNIGIIAGTWFSAYGINTLDFMSFVVAFNVFI